MYGDAAHRDRSQPVRKIALWRVPPRAWQHAGRLSSLEELTIVASDLRGERLAPLGKLENLRRLTVINSQFTPPELKHLANCRQLEHLDLMFSVLEEDAPLLADQLGELSPAEQEELDRLVAATNGKRRFAQVAILTGRAMSHLSGLKRLKGIRLANTFLSDMGLAHLDKATALEELDVSFLGFSAASARLLQGNAELRFLRGINLSDDALAELAPLKNLENLDAWAGEVTDRGAQQLAKLTKLRELGIRGSQLSDRGILALAQLPDLRSLDLRHAQGAISEAGLVQFNQTNPRCNVLLDELKDPPAAEAPMRPHIDPQAIDVDALRDTSDLARLQGAWEVVEYQEAGKQAALDKRSWIIIAADRFIWKWASGAKMDAQYMLLNPPTRRKKINVFFADKPDDELRGIYTINGDTLKLCIAENSGLDRPTKFVAGGESFATLVTLRRLKQTPAELLPELEAMQRTIVKDAGSKNAPPATGAAEGSPQDSKAVENVDIQQIASLNAAQTKPADILPDWLRAFHNHGLSARIDDGGQVVEITAGQVIDDALLAKITTLPNLKKLYVETSERISAAGMAHIAEMPALQSLTFYSIKLPDEALAPIGRMKSLRELSLTECQISDAGLADLRDLHDLKVLKLGGNRITDQGLENIADFTELVDLDISNTSWVDSKMQVTDAGLAHLKKLTKLRGLDISTLAITDEGFGTLDSLRELRRLDLAGTQITSAGLRHLANFPQLQALHLGGAWIRNEGMRHVGQCTNLSDLSLIFTRVDDDGLKHLGSLRKLERLSIGSSQITGAGLASVATLMNLRHLELRSSQLEDEGMKQIASIGSLRRLDLSGGGPGVHIGGRITGAGMAHLKKMKGLETLWLANLEVSWIDLKDLKWLKELDFMMVSMSADDVRRLQRELPDTRVSAAWGGSSVPPAATEPGGRCAGVLSVCFVRTTTRRSYSS